MSNFSKRLRFLRTTAKLSQQELANRIGISKSSINMYERGEREPGLETLEIIADFFNVDMDYLMGRQEKQRIIDVTGDFTSKASNKFSLNPHEEEVITAYRNQPEMQPAVDKLLGISQNHIDHLTPIAAHNNVVSKEESELMRKDIEKLKNL